MKVVFPRKGAMVLAKEDIKTLYSFYHTNLITSKIYEMYPTTEFIIQAGNLTYLPTHTSITFHNVNPLTLSEMHHILELTNSHDTSSTNQEEIEENVLQDEDFLSHPFFQTLKPLD